MIVFYHGGCPDGFTAAWVAHMHNSATTLIPYFHGTELKVSDIPDGSEVYLIDFTVQNQVMKSLAERVDLRILDHHVTSKDRLSGLEDCSEFDLSRSGAMLAWDEFFPDEPPCTLVQYAQDCDLWTWKLPHSRAINAWIQSHERTLLNFYSMESELQRRFLDIVKEGEAILRSEETRVLEICQNAQFIGIGGHIVPMVNTAALFSQAANRLCLMYPEHNFAGYYFDRADGQRQWGLRSNNGFDVSEIAKLFGGGGHPAAAGFETAQPLLLPARD